MFAYITSLLQTLPFLFTGLYGIFRGEYSLKNINQYAFRALMYLFYHYYKNEAWTIYSNAPSSGNIAFPDCSVTYYVSFLTHRNIQLHGLIPDNTNIFSITMYDINGTIIYYIDDSHMDSNDTHYYVKLNDLPSIYAIIARYYIKPQHYAAKENVVSFLPQITYTKHHDDDTNEIKQRVPTASLLDRQRNTKNLSSLYTFFVTKRRIVLQENFAAFNPPVEPIKMYFPNNKAVYSILRVHSIHDVIIIKGTHPMINSKTNIRFMGFMLCNYLTTQTDTSVGLEQLCNFKEKNEKNDQNYTIFVTDRIEGATNHGYNKENGSHALLLWNPSNQYPLVVYREVKIHGRELLYSPKTVIVHPF